MVYPIPDDDHHHKYIINTDTIMTTVTKTKKHHEKIETRNAQSSRTGFSSNLKFITTFIYYGLHNFHWVIIFMIIYVSS
jgi:hypothetical protein